MWYILPETRLVELLDFERLIESHRECLNEPPRVYGVYLNGIKKEIREAEKMLEERLSVSDAISEFKVQRDKFRRDLYQAIGDHLDIVSKDFLNKKDAEALGRMISSGGFNYLEVKAAENIGQVLGKARYGL